MSWAKATDTSLVFWLSCIGFPKMMDKIMYVNVVIQDSWCAKHMFRVDSFVKRLCVIVEVVDVSILQTMLSTFNKAAVCIHCIAVVTF